MSVPQEGAELDAGPPPRRGVGARHAFQAAAVGVVVALLGVLVWNVIHGGEGGRFVASIEKNEHPRAPGFQLGVVWPHTETWPQPLRATIDDGTLKLSELRGYPVILNFWASWCIPCKREARAFGAAARAHVGKVVFVGVNVQDLHSASRSFLERYEVPYVSVHDNGDETYRAYGLTGLPETYYLDRRGRVLAHDIGEVTRAELEHRISLMNS